jgi:hypothetical protein
MSTDLQTANDPPLKRRRGRPATGNDPSRTARFPQPLLEAMLAEAAKRQTSFAAVIREAAQKYVAALEGQSAA